MRFRICRMLALAVALTAATSPMYAQDEADYLAGFAESAAKDPAVAAETARLAEAQEIRTKDPKRAETIFREILDTTAVREHANEAWQALQGMGVTGDPAHERGYLTQYWLVGPFPGDELDAPWPPERAYLEGASWDGADPAPWEGLEFPAKGGSTAKWRPEQIYDVFGYVDLLRNVSPEYYVVAYAVSVVYVDAAQSAELRVGSDDGVAVWLNGAQAHENDAVRKYARDEDHVPVELRAGRNEFFFKIANGERLWAFSARLLDTDGAPAAFRHTQGDTYDE